MHGTLASAAPCNQSPQHGSVQPFLIRFQEAVNKAHNVPTESDIKANAIASFAQYIQAPPRRIVLLVPLLQHQLRQPHTEVWSTMPRILCLVHRPQHAPSGSFI